jgi:flagellar biosynthetic protein FliR
MSLQLDIGWLFATALLAVRIAAATAFTPVLGPAQIPGSVRVILAFVLGAAIVSGLPYPVAAPPDSAWVIVGSMLKELVTGCCLSLGFLSAYAATLFAGRALDVQVGFAVASTLNPASKEPSPLFGTVLSMAGVAVFLGLDGHHVLIRALSSTVPFSQDWGALISQSAVMFSFGAVLAGPIMFTLLLVDLSMAVLARSMPSLNVFILSFAVKIIAGMIGLAVGVKLGGPLLEALYGTTFTYWRTVSQAP